MQQGINSSILLERARSGDQIAIEQLLQMHDTALRVSIDINPKWRSILEVDDVLQVTYMEAVLDLSKFQGDEASLGTWLRSIAQNNLRDAIKGLEREKRPHPDRRTNAPVEQDAVLWLWNFLTGSAFSPSGKIAHDEINDVLEMKVAELPVAYADVVRLVYFKEQGIADAASALERTYGAVYLLHQRALDRLRELIGSESQFFSG